jgi:hypothetical protein
VGVAAPVAAARGRDTLPVEQRLGRSLSPIRSVSARQPHCGRCEPCSKEADIPVAYLIACGQ